MQGTFGDIISASWEWTKTILFRPFKLKKWIFLCVIALLAAEFSGCGINFNYPREKTQQVSPAPPFQKPEWPACRLVPVLIAAGIIALIVFLLYLWLYSRFSFVFLNSVIRNDASIKAPFKENKPLGNSFFKWNLTFLLCISAVFLTMLFIFISGIKISVLLIILWIFTVFILAVFFIIVNVITHDLVLPIMLRDKIRIIKGWQETLGIIRSEKLQFIKYLLIKLALRIAAGIAGGLFSMVVFLVLFIQLSILGGLLYAVSFALPEAIRWGYYILLITLGIITLTAIIFLINFTLLPIPVFFRTYSLEFLARLDERYNFKKEGV